MFYTPNDRHISVDKERATSTTFTSGSANRGVERAVLLDPIVTEVFVFGTSTALNSVLLSIWLGGVADVCTGTKEGVMAESCVPPQLLRRNDPDHHSGNRRQVCL